MPTNAPTVGGAEIFLQRLAADLSARGWDVTVVCPSHGAVGALHSNQPYAVIQLNLGICAVRWRGIGTLAALDWRRARAFRRLVADFVCAGAPAVLVVQDPTQQVWSAGLSANTALRTVIVSHSPFHFPLMRLILAPLFIRACQRANRVLTVSQHHRQNLISAGLDASKVATIPVGRTPAPALVTFPADTRAFTIGTFSRLQREKGIDTAITAVALLSDRFDLRLMVAGSGPDRSRLERLAQQLGLAERVEFVGHVQNAQRAMGDCYAVVVPSRDAGESSPAVVIEAQMAGTCVVATPIPALKELLADERAGVLAHDEGAPALAAALEGVLADIPRRNAIAAYGHATIQATHHTDVMLDRLEAELQAVWAP
jgi:glycosyltransferase involved in cell wall biosynthesis